MPTPTRGEIRLKNETIAPYPNYLISRGFPLPPGAATDPSQVSIRDEAGSLVPSAGKVLQHRPDGSIEWLHIDLLTDFEPEEKKSLYIECQANQPPTVEHPVVIADEADSVRMGNGITDMVISKTGGSIIRTMTMHGKTIVAETDLVDLEAVDLDGKVHRASVNATHSVSITHANALKTTVTITGKHAARDGQTFIDFALRITLCANRADVRFDHTFYNREPANSTTQIKALRFVMPTRMDPAARKVIRQAHHGQTFFPRGVTIRENVEVVGTAVNDVNHFQRDYKPYKNGVLYLRNFSSLRENVSEYPFHMYPQGGSPFRAEHMTGGVRQMYPWLGWREDDFTLVFAMRWWKQLHPKSVVIDEHVLCVSLWPEWSVPMVTVAGVNKTHTFYLAAEPTALDYAGCESKALQWEVQGYEPMNITIDPAWPAHCRVADCQHILRYQPDKYPKLENKLKVTPGEPNRFTYPRHVPNGMFNFGCHGGEGGFTNNEDDVRVFAPLLDYLRTGHAYHFDFGEEAATHYFEVDFCEWSQDPRQHGGLIPHTVDHFIGSVYPSHQWAEGVLLYYYLTGDERARHVVIACGDNNVYWTHNVLEAICCDGREAGMPLVNLAAAYRLTQDKKYIDAAHVIINNFQKKWYDMWGDLKYPYPQGGATEAGGQLKWITGYGDWSSYYGLYRIWEVTQDEDIRTLLVALLEKFCDPSRFSLDDSRGMDFMAVWAYIHLTDDLKIIDKLKDPIDNFLQKGGHPMRRLHFLGTLDAQGKLPTE